MLVPTMLVPTSRAVVRPILRCGAPRCLLADAEDLAAPVGAVGEGDGELVQAIDTLVDAAEDLITDVSGQYLGESAPLVLAVLGVGLGFVVLNGAVQLTSKALDAAKPVLAAALGLLVVTVGFGTSVQLTQIPFVGGLLGDPVTLFFKLAALLAAVLAAAVAYSKTTEVAANVAQSVSAANEKVTQSVSAAKEKVTGSVNSANDKLAAAVPKVDIPDLPDLPDLPSVPAVKNPFRTPEGAAPAAPPAAPRGPSFGERYQDKIAELKERDAKKKGR